MRRLVSILVMLFVTMMTHSQEESLQQLYDQLDNDIANAAKFEEQRRLRITKLRDLMYSSPNSNQAHYDLLFRLFEEYRSYENDSAVACLRECSEIARRMERKDLEGECLSRLAFQCSTVGLYTEALVSLEKVDKGALNRDQLARYYLANYHVYGELGYYSVMKDLSGQYYAKSDHYRDSVFMVANKTDDMYLQLKEMQLYNQKKYDEAMKINDQRLQLVKPGSHEYAVVAYYRYLLYNIRGDVEEAKKWLAKSSICDVENAVMDQASLWSLANMISNEGGDLNRAYNYVSYAWNCAMHFGTRVRNSQIAPILWVIESKYQEEVRQSNRTMRLFVVALSLLALLSLSLLYYVNKQRHKLAHTQDDMKRFNQQLAELNAQLSQANDELDQRNRELSGFNQAVSQSNTRLNDANRVKDEYIGRFLGLCSAYVDKLEAFRKRVNKMVKNKQIDELYEMTKTTELKDRELEELYSNFDEVFLRLFPNFVEDFNALLRPEDRLSLTEDKHLPITMRIFALIRLGIEDSSKIADFLHYSVNTIYNYRARVKNGAVVDREDFEKRVKELGLPKAN